jgi:hypothetical protein
VAVGVIHQDNVDLILFYWSVEEGRSENDPPGRRLDLLLAKNRGRQSEVAEYDTRHMLTELDPKPEFVTVATGTTQWDIISMLSTEDIPGTHLADPKVRAAWAGMVVDATPAFYLEHLKRLRQNKIQPNFVPADGR